MHAHGQARKNRAGDEWALHQFGDYSTFALI